MAEWLLDRWAAIFPRANRRLAKGLGRLWYRLDGRHRDIALRNLQLALGDELDEKEREAVARENFIHLTRVMLEIPCLRKLSPGNLDRFVIFRGLENFDAALQKGRGLLVLAAHFGNWEMMALAFSLRHRPIHIVVRPLDNPLVDAVINGIRTRGGNSLIGKKGSVRSILRLLHQGQPVALLMDQNVDWYDGVFVPFFREIACTNKALTVLALRTGAPVVPVYNVRQGDGRYRIVFEPEIPVVRTGDTTRDTEENTARFNRIIEGYVRRHPEQWFWVHQRWKTRPWQPWPGQAK